jgi:carbonic anhydrase
VRVPKLRARALFPGWSGTRYGEVAMNDRTKASRRELVTFAGAFGSASSRMLKAQTPLKPDSRPVTPDQALHDLIAGNQRFLTGNRTSPRGRPEEFRALAHGQFPEAVVVCCADSRVAPEILFDVGVGDIFVVRVAGNVIEGAGATVKGSIEYAVAELNVPLILVLGHSGCGAVKSAIQHIDKSDSLPGAINSLVELIKPAVEMSKGLPGDSLENAIRQNVHTGVEKLQRLEPIVGPRVKEGKLDIVGGVYDLSTGSVILISNKKRL